MGKKLIFLLVGTCRFEAIAPALVYKHILHTSLQNHTCHYEISSQVSKAHLETLFGPLDYEVEGENDYFGPEIDIGKSNF